MAKRQIACDADTETDESASHKIWVKKFFDNDWCLNLKIVIMLKCEMDEDAKMVIVKNTITKAVKMRSKSITLVLEDFKIQNQDHFRRAVLYERKRAIMERVLRKQGKRVNYQKCDKDDSKLNKFYDTDGSVNIYFN